MTAQLTFTADGKPIGQGNHRQNRYGATYETTKGHAAWRKTVKKACTDAMPDHWQPLEGPASIHITLRIARTANHYGTGRNALRLKASAPQRPTHGQHPDLDKAVRAILDACTDAKAWLDDKQVTSITATKAYADGITEPGATITITELTT